MVALTTFRDKELVHSTLQAGAVGFLYKDASVDELAGAIRRAYRGDAVMLAPQAAEALLELIDARARKTSAPPQNCQRASGTYWPCWWRG